MRYNQFMELPPQSLARLDEPVAGPQKSQSQSDKNQISHFRFPPFSFPIIHSNHWGINGGSKNGPKGSRKGQILERLPANGRQGIFSAFSPDPVGKKRSEKIHPHRPRGGISCPKQDSIGGKDTGFQNSG
jgi:hypothetical protein